MRSGSSRATRNDLRSAFPARFIDREKLVKPTRRAASDVIQGLFDNPRDVTEGDPAIEESGDRYLVCRV
jgi:hypothetical protein